jgi:hypothetical protein
VASTSLCPGCGSGLLQPLRCEPREQGDVQVDLRCPECYSWLQESLSGAEMRELDRRQSDLRRELVRAYERCVAESMEALAFCLRTALELDLLGADDFAPRARGVKAPPPPTASGVLSGPEWLS